MELLKPIMFVGTASDVGKSVINAAFCRIFKQDGYAPAPFKAQNMSLNSYATPEGLEIGRAQAMQAEACGLPCHVDMNPVLLKPTGNGSSQVVLKGKSIGNQSAKQYYLNTDREMLFSEAMAAYSRLEAQYNPMVIEGAGSISELNLWDKDITNMRVALEVGASVFLITDIDRGGVFASLYGTIMLLPPNQRSLIKGIIINKFRGDISLFSTGRALIEELTSIPVVGVISYFTSISLDDEDSVALASKSQVANKKQASLKIGVVLLKHMSNFTDFNTLERLPNVHLYYANTPADIESADIVIIPGSKNTIADMLYLRQSGLAKAILDAHSNQKSVYGICGGYQMMGELIYDPHHVEGDIEMIPGLGILPTTTTITSTKTTKQRTFNYLSNSQLCKGYEIHMGETSSHIKSPLCTLDSGEFDGFYLDAKTWGTYLHGIFDNSLVINDILSVAGHHQSINNTNPDDFKENEYNKLANWVREKCDMDIIYNSLKL